MKDITNLKYPIGVQDFPSLRENGWLYVDKTAYIHKLVNGSVPFTFLSRPRRFGKSLLLSTIEAYFQGRRELFKGLEIDRLEPDAWDEYAVLHLDFNKQGYFKAGDLEDTIEHNLQLWEKTYGRDESETSHTLRFLGIIRRAKEKTGRGVVVLIDEYDKPVLDLIDQPELMEANRQLLKSFYGGMKSSQGNLRFVMLTGVGKIAQLNVFSGLNNIRDISMEEDYSGICGISEVELHSIMEPSVQLLADRRNYTLDEAYAKLKLNYDGYHFAEDLLDIYNPWSLFNALASRKISDYWYATGTPSHLIKSLRTMNIPIRDLDGCEADGSALLYGNVTGEDPVPILYYSGYLTVKSYDGETDTYTLGYPNEEVKHGFLNNVLTIIGQMQNPLKSSMLIRKMKTLIVENRTDEFLEVMKSFMAGFDHIAIGKNEYHYQTVMYCICKLLGLDSQMEVHTAEGRIDMFIATDTHIYVMEFKFDKPIREACDQMEEKHYALPFAIDQRKVVKVAVVFSSKTHTIDDWCVMPA